MKKCMKKTGLITWKKYYKPSKVGEKIVVKPIWEEYEAKEW